MSFKPDLRRKSNRLLGRLYQLWNNYYVNRTLQAVFTLYAVVTIAFVMLRMLPGSPAQQLKIQRLREAQQSGRSVNMEAINAQVEAYLNINPSKPMWQEYIDYMSAFFTGDFGQSLWYNEPVIDLLATALPWTMLLSSGATLIGLVTGIVLGILMAYYEGSKFDTGLTLYTVFMNSIPFYVLGILFIYLFVYQFGIFPNGGQYQPGTNPGFNWPFIEGVLKFIALPLSAFVLTGFGGALGMRANCIRILGEDYLRVARLRGLSAYRIALRYVGRNAVLPLYTGFMISLGSFFGGAIIIEEIFKYPGMGFLTFGAIQHGDYALMLGGFILITAAVVIGILLADFTYGWVDPRAKTSNREAYASANGNVMAGLKRRLNQLRGDGSNDEEGPAWQEDTATSQIDGASPFDFSHETETTESVFTRMYRRFDKMVYAPFMVLWSDTRGKVAMFILAVYTFTATVGAWITPFPTANQYPRLVGPFHGGVEAIWQEGGWIEPGSLVIPQTGLSIPWMDLRYPLGTNGSGKDLLALMVKATPPMFEMIIAGAIFATIMAAGVGILAGFRGGTIDRVLMTIADIVMTIPGLPLTIILAAIFQPRNPYLIGLMLTVNAWGGTARQLRSQTLSLRESEYIEASRAMGLSTSTILVKDFLPNLMPYALIKFVGKARGVIFGSVGLYYLGVLPFSSLNWGIVLNTSYNSGTALLLWDAAHWFIVPCATIVFFSFGLYLFSQAADQLTNPRVRARHAKTVDEEEAETSAPASTAAAQH